MFKMPLASAVDMLFAYCLKIELPPGTWERRAYVKDGALIVEWTAVKEVEKRA